MRQLRDIYEEVRAIRGVAILDETDSQAVIYKGLKFCSEDGNFFILSTATDIYTELSFEMYLEFLNYGLEAGIRKFRNQRFMSALSKLSNDAPAFKEIFKLWKQK